MLLLVPKFASPAQPGSQRGHNITTPQVVDSIQCGDAALTDFHINNMVYDPITVESVSSNINMMI